MSLKEYQILIDKLAKERGFSDESVQDKLILLVEEVGELAKAIRQSSHMRNGQHSEKHEVSDELADVFWLLLTISNKLNIDLETAFENKEKKNSKREYS